MKLLILPHQLFDPKYFPEGVKDIILYEHPQYFKKYNFNKKKIMLHRASMKEYQDLLQKKKFSVKYIEASQKFTFKKGDFVMFDPIDKIKVVESANEVLESPNFLLTMTQYGELRKKSDKFFFNSFYMNGKKMIDIIPSVKSQDKQNRQKMPKTLEVPTLPGMKEDKYIKEAKQYVEKHFKANYGNVDNFWYPTNHKEARVFLKHFIEKRFEKFGPYQDFMVQGKDYMFHSCLSTSINIGLLNPLEIIEEIRGLEKKIPLNSYEGYIRQLFWREYQRYTYLFCDFSENYFGNKKKLGKEWYEGTTGCDPVDYAIKAGFESGYLHHIYRLMVVGNYMNLCEISPMEGLKWFMEFSCDSYEWVMYQNVLDMVFFVTGGKTMRKPYASSSNYVVNMSDFKKGKWSEEWDKKYRKFMENNVDKLWKFRYSFPALKKIKAEAEK